MDGLTTMAATLVAARAGGYLTPALIFVVVGLLAIVFRRQIASINHRTNKRMYEDVGPDDEAKETKAILMGGVIAIVMGISFAGLWLLR